MSLFEVKLSYIKETEKGFKRVTETNIIEAFTFMECETILNQECDVKLLKDHQIKSMKPISISEIFRDEVGGSDTWYRVKVVLIDPETDKGHKQVMYVQANSIDDAIFSLKKHMKDTIVDWESTEIKKTDVYEIILK